MPDEAALEPVLPTITDLNRPFWDGAAAGELRMQACTRCGHIRYPISDTCPRCLDPGYEWRRLSGDGEVLSYMIFHRGYHAAWKQVPYNVVLVQLAEGPRMFSNVVPVERTDLRVGMPVRVTFAGVDGISIPRFVPRDEVDRDALGEDPAAAAREAPAAA